MTIIKQISLFFALSLFYHLSYAQNFKVVKFLGSNIHTIDLQDTVNGEGKTVGFFGTIKQNFYDPVLQKDTFKFILDTIIHRKVDTLKLIEELLDFEGDKRTSRLEVMNYGKWSCGTFYTGDLKPVSLQVHALVLIYYSDFGFPIKNNNFVQKTSQQCKLL